MALKKVNLRKVNAMPVTALIGPQGTQGRDGLDGTAGNDGRDGLTGLTGSPGAIGLVGPMPLHKWNGTELSFQQPDGTFSHGVDLRGEAGSEGKAGKEGQSNTGGGGAALVQYKQVRTAEYRVRAAQMQPGINILGVFFDGAVTITLPRSMPNTSILNIKDEGSFGHAITVIVAT